MIGLAKFLKGSTTIGELENMSNKFIHTLYKMYIDTMRDQKKAEGVASEQMVDELEDALT